MNTQKMIQVLLTAVDSGSLSKAGEILGYTQSNLTQMVTSYENEIGFPLLIKTKKGVEPTREALQLLPTMRAMRAQEERFFQEADEIRGIRKGSIRIGTYVSTSSAWLPGVLGYFQQNFPDVEFHLGIFRLIVPDHLGQPGRRSTHIGSDADRASADAADLVGFLQEPVFRSRHRAHRRNELLCLAGRLDAFLGLDEKGNAKFVLEGFHHLGQVGLGVSQDLACTGETPAVDRGEKDFDQLECIHCCLFSVM